jgi:hypothetical protein
MKCYRDDTGALHRTQADAKASGRPFEPEIIPNDQQGLIDYINAQRARAQPSTMEEFISQHAVVVRAPEGDPELRAAYQNGDPTTPYLGSRDPAARFTCTACGKNNFNG